MVLFGDLLDFLPDKSSDQEALILKLLLASIAAVVVGVIINRILSRTLTKLAEILTVRAKTTSKGERLIQVKRTETVLSVGAAVARTLILAICLYIAWRVVNPSSVPIALIGASTFFIVLGAATIGPLLRDLTSGILMIAEHWYNVGDHITVDPFWELEGVVEQMSLRSTKIRTLRGEAVWIHNQYIQAVRVANRGAITISVDTFVRDLEKGRALINSVLVTMPTGPTMIASPLKITEEEENGNIWRITITGQTAPERNWLIEVFTVNAIQEADQASDKPIIIHGPIVRYTDALAEKYLKRSMLYKR